MEGRPRQQEKYDSETIELVPFIAFVVRVFFGACSDDSRRSLQSGPERTSPTLEPKSLRTGESPSIVRGTEGFGVSRGSET